MFPGHDNNYRKSGIIVFNKMLLPYFCTYRRSTGFVATKFSGIAMLEINGYIIQGLRQW